MAGALDPASLVLQPRLEPLSLLRCKPGGERRPIRHHRQDDEGEKNRGDRL
jgi:hypothetical protein